MNKRMILLLAGLISAHAYADLGHKAPLKADFRSMIDDTYQERTSLANGVSETITHKSARLIDRDADARRVTDFIDVEVGWGEAPKMVDRRFDSVDESEQN